MAGYNRTRYVEHLLEKTEGLPPSFTVHLHPEYWVLNNGSKFLYHNQIASLLDDIRGHRIPIDFLELFDSARVPFYDGCMVVELLDYRPQRSKEPALKIPEKTRVVLHPNSETLWADICSLNQKHGGKWTDKDALEIEAKLLLATSQPLCLDPDPHLTRIVNHVLRMSTPTMPMSLKRKASALEPEEDGPEKVRRDKILSFMAPRERSHAANYRLLDAINAARSKTEEGAASAAAPTPVSSNQFMSTTPQPPQPSQPQPPAAPPTPAPMNVQAHSPTDSDNKTQKARKPDTPQMPGFNVAFLRSNGSHTPIPPQPTHQFVNQHPPPTHPPTNGNALMQPQVYANVQAATEAAKRAATPAQQLQIQHHALQLQQQQMQQQHHYLQQYQLHQQQQQQLTQQQSSSQQTQQPPQQQSRPSSQPQHPQPQQQPPTQSLATTQQHQQPQQRFTQSPKPPIQANTTNPPHPQPTPQSYPGVPAGFQPPIPNPHFLQQPPSGVRNPSHSQTINPTQQQQPQAQSQQVPQQIGQQSHAQNPSNSSQAQAVAQAQLLYSHQVQLNQMSQQMTQQQRANFLMQQQQRILQAQNAQNNGGGRLTPQAQAQIQAGIGQQGLGQSQMQGAVGTPSPVRSSPVVNTQHLTAVRSSPMPAKAQIQPQPQQQQLTPQQQMTLHPQRMAFAPQYNPSQLRPLVHGVSPQGHMVIAPAQQQQSVPRHATPTPGQAQMAAAASPQGSTGPRPTTPAVLGGDGKQQQQVQQPLRQQTPSQQQHQIQQQQQMQLAAASRTASQSQSPRPPQAQVQPPGQPQRTPQLQSQQLHRTPQLQQHPQQHSSPQTQAQAPSPAQGQSQAQAPSQPQSTQPQQPAQMTHPTHYPQMYGYGAVPTQMNFQMPAYWRNMPAAMAQQQQQQAAGMGGAATSGGQPMMTNGQQAQQAQQAQQGQGGLLNGQQLSLAQQGAMMSAQQKLQQQQLVAQQGMMMSGQQGAQGMMMGKVQPQGQGRGKAGPKKAPAKRGGGVQR